MKRYVSLNSARKSIILQVVFLSVIVMILCFGSWISDRGRSAIDLLLAYNREDLQTDDLEINWEDETIPVSDYEVYCKNIIDRREPDSSTAQVCYVTTNYHVFRSGILANRVGLTGEGLGAKTRWWFWPNAYIRECVGFFANRKLMILYLAIIAFIAVTVIRLTDLMF